MPEQFEDRYLKLRALAAYAGLSVKSLRGMLKRGLPNKTKKYNLKMTCQAVNLSQEVSKDLTLSVRRKILVS